MRRLLGMFIVVAAVAVPVATAKPVPLERYWTSANAEIHAYRGLLRRLEAILSEGQQTNVDPLVERLYRLADRFEALAGSWQAIDAPQGLRVRHRGMGRVFVLFADAYRIYAAALFTRHSDEFAAAIPKVKARLSSAAYLQRRWAAALQGALVRAGIRVPGWLHLMSSGP